MYLQDETKISVMDCFSGEAEAIWSALSKEFKIREYLALDLKRKRGRLAIDSLRVLQGQKWTHNVVDLDAYGSPWNHWHEVIKSNRHKSIIVFLTVGSSGFGRLSDFARKSMGIPSNTPHGMDKILAKNSVSFCLAKCYEYDWIIDKAHEALNPGGNARYIAIKLTKKYYEPTDNNSMDRPYI